MSINKIAVAIGHTLNGADYGASGLLVESNETRAIGEVVKNKLDSQGFNIVLCRIDNAASVNDSLAYRVNKANSENVDLYIEIHLNAGGGKGTETHIIGTGGQAGEYGKSICNAICELGYANRGVKISNFYVLRNTVAPAVLIECCFVDSQEDYNRYNAEAIANKIVKGISGNEPTAASTSIDFDAVAMEHCEISLTDAVGGGCLDPLELCQILTVNPETYQREVKYQGWDRIKKGLVNSGSVLLLEDAYNYYNAGQDNIIGYKDEQLITYEGIIYPNEKICVSYIDADKGIAYIRFDSAADGPLRHLGFCKASNLRRIGEPPIQEEVKEEHILTATIVTSDLDLLNQYKKDLEAKQFTCSIK